MVYVDYKYYTENFFGTLPEDSFNSAVLKASREIDNNVNTRLTEEKINTLSVEAQEQLKYTTCALTDLLHRKEESLNRKVNSISIDGVTKNFSAISNEEYKKIKKDILENLPIDLTRFL